MTSPGVNPLLALPPPTSDVVGGSVYGDMLAAFFSTLTDAERQKIWVAFLAQNNLTDPPVVDVATQKLFLNYVQGVFDSQHNTILSQDEVKKRTIMFSVFNELIDMLLAIQNVVGVQAQALALYGRWQQQYTRMMARVPTYVGGESSDIQLPPGSNTQTGFLPAGVDLSKFTFGYNNISVTDIAQWYANNHLPGSNTSNQTFEISAYYPFALNPVSSDGNVSMSPFASHDGGAGGTFYISKLTFKVVDGQFRIELQTPQFENVKDQKVLVDSEGNAVYGPPILLSSGTISVPPQQTFTAIADSFENDFVSWWNGSGASTILNGYYTQTYNWLDDDSNAHSVTVPVYVGTYFTNIHSNDGNPPYLDQNVFADYINDPKRNSLGNAIPNDNMGDEGLLYNIDYGDDEPGNGYAFQAPQTIHKDPVLNQIFRRTNYTTDPFAFLQIPKPYTFVAPANNTDSGNKDRNLGDANAKSRAEINARDQQYIENIRSNRQVVQDASSQIQSNLDQSRQAVSQQADLLTSIIDSLKGMIASIFR